MKNNIKIILNKNFSKTDAQIELPSGTGNVFEDYIGVASYSYRDTSGRVIEREIFKILSRNGDILTIQRAVEKCPVSEESYIQEQTPVDFRIGGEISVRITAGHINGKINQKGDVNDIDGKKSGSFNIDTSGEIKSSKFQTSNYIPGQEGQQIESGGGTSMSTLRFDSEKWRLYAGRGGGEVFNIGNDGKAYIKGLLQTFKSGGSADAWGAMLWNGKNNNTGKEWTIGERQNNADNLWFETKNDAGSWRRVIFTRDGGIHCGDRSGITGNMEHKPGIAIGDSDTGFSSYGDGLLEAWANNQRVFNFNSSTLEIQKRLFGPGYKGIHTTHDVRGNNFGPDRYNRESIHYGFVEASTIGLPNTGESRALVKTYNKWDNSSQNHKLYQIAYNGNAIYLRTNTDSTHWGGWTLIGGGTQSASSADFIKVIDPSSGVHTLNHNLGKAPTVIKVEVYRCNQSGSPSSASYGVIGMGVWKSDGTQHTMSAYDGKSYLASKDGYVFRNQYGNVSSIKIQNVTAGSIDINCEGTFNSGNNYHKVHITLF